MENILFKTNAQKILEFLIQHPTEEFLVTDIRKENHLSRAGINFALQKLLKQKLINRKAKGKAYVYQAKADFPLVKQLKVLYSVMKLQSLIDDLKALVDKIILFGSCSRGENTEDSDIDLLAITRNKKEVKDKLNKFNKLKINTIIKTFSELEELSENNTAFYNEINRGIILFAKDNEY